ARARPKFYFLRADQWCTRTRVLGTAIITLFRVPHKVAAACGRPAPYHTRTHAGRGKVVPCASVIRNRSQQMWLPEGAMHCNPKRLSIFGFGVVEAFVDLARVWFTPQMSQVRILCRPL